MPQADARLAQMDGGHADARGLKIATIRIRAGFSTAAATRQVVSDLFGSTV